MSDADSEKNNHGADMPVRPVRPVRPAKPDGLSMSVVEASKLVLARLASWWAGLSVRPLAKDLEGAVPMAQKKLAEIEAKAKSVIKKEESLSIEATKVRKNESDIKQRIDAQQARAANQHQDAVVAWEIRLTAAIHFEGVLKKIADESVAWCRTLEDQETTAKAEIILATEPHMPTVRRGEKRAKKTNKNASEEVQEVQYTRTKSRVAAATKLIVDEASYPILFAPEVALCEVFRDLPEGAFDYPVQCKLAYAQVLGALGKLNDMVDWTAADADKQAIRVLHSDYQSQRKRGGQIKHVFSDVLNKPKTANGPTQQWSDDEVVRAGRWHLVSLGVDPDRHPVVFFRHRQAPGKNGKVEETIHIVGSRVRDDGAIHTCNHGCVAACIGRARWDYYAGIDPGRLEMTTGKKKPLVRDGLELLSNKMEIDKPQLVATYNLPNGAIETISLLGEKHSEKLAAEGSPVNGSCAGTWVVKPHYRSPKSIEEAIKHIMNGD